MATNRERGKRAERAIAQRVNGIRMGTMGNEDVHMDSSWSIEVKSRKAFVACDWVDQAARNAPKGKTPVVIVHIAGKRHSKDLVILRMEDAESVLKWST